jgi:tRNA nucleotidyltransferase (CCA-adding enzyme)
MQLFAVNHPKTLMLTLSGILQKYTTFLNQLVKEDMLEADTFKPLVNGKELASAMSIKPGPWMKDALDVVMAWQLRNPNITDPAQAIEEVKKSRNSELPSRLISHFLSLTIPPLFPQTKTTEDKPWKNPKNEYFVDLFRWSLKHAGGQGIKTNMHLLRPPIMEMLDDSDLAWRAKGCELLKLLIEAAPPDFITSHGYDKMFSTELLPFFNFLPSLTPESESVTLLEQAFPALITLCITTGKEEKFLDRLLREGILAPLHHFPTPTTYPKLATLLLTQLTTLTDLLQINSVKHLEPVLSLLGTIMNDPLTPSHPPLLLVAINSSEAVLRNGWPRINHERAMVIYVYTCKAWLNCTGRIETGFKDAKMELKKLLATVDGLLMQHKDEGVRNAWLDEKKRAAGLDMYKGLF